MSEPYIEMLGKGYFKNESYFENKYNVLLSEIKAPYRLNLLLLLCIIVN